jgi:hypothetical protein
MQDIYHTFVERYTTRSYLIRLNLVLHVGFFILPHLGRHYNILLLLPDL